MQSEVSDASNEPTASWLQPVPMAYRLKRARIALGIAVALASGIGYAQWSNGIIGQPESLWLLVILAVGAWRYRVWMRKETVRRFSTVKVQLSQGTRFKRASPFFALGLGLTVIMLYFQALDDVPLATRLMGVLALAPLSLLGALVYAFNKTQTVETPEAAKMRAYYESLDVAKGGDAKGGEWADKLGALLSLKIVRYPGAALLIYVAWYFAMDPKSKGWEWALFAIWALFAARELTLWLIGGGIVVGVMALLFHGVAALPVSVAVIIAALIIAGAMKK